ncbi:MAG: hypothetical protein HKN20_10425 [Gemmatimonadetes bacterium]|nr:hypothetical protein [Gemmatimonadota bacterium]
MSDIQIILLATLVPLTLIGFLGPEQSVVVRPEPGPEALYPDLRSQAGLRSLEQMPAPGEGQ